MKNFISVDGLSRRELDNMIKKNVSELIQEELVKYLHQREKPRLLTRIQTAEYLGIDLSTLHAWVTKGRLKMYAVGQKRYFKEDEILESLIHLNPSSHEL